MEGGTWIDQTKTLICSRQAALVAGMTVKNDARWSWISGVIAKMRENCEPFFHGPSQGQFDHSALLKSVDQGLYSIFTSTQFFSKVLLYATIKWIETYSAPLELRLVR